MGYDFTGKQEQGGELGRRNSGDDFGALLESVLELRKLGGNQMVVRRLNDAEQLIGIIQPGNEYIRSAGLFEPWHVREDLGMGDQAGFRVQSVNELNQAKVVGSAENGVGKGTENQTG